MLQNLALAVTTFLVLVASGALIGRRVVPVAPVETQLVAGAGLVTLYSGASVALALMIPGTERVWMVLVAVPILVVAGLGLADWRILLGSHAFRASLLLVVVASAMMATPYNPAGEFDTGSVYATRIPGRPADNRLPYRTVQFVLHEIDPDQRYFIDWGLTDRTQLAAGLPTMAVALLGPDVPPDEIWYRPADQVGFLSVDPFGYWVVRNVVIALNGLLPLGIAALTVPWFNREVGSLAAIAASLSVFALVETAFTWPKFIAVAIAASAGGAFLLARPIVGGVLSGVAYLFHPVGALLIPAVVWLAWRRGAVGRKAILVSVISVGVVVAPWTFWVSVIEGKSSRMTLYPIGWVLTSGDTMSEELPLALEAFWNRFPFGVLHDRWVSLRDSLDLTRFFTFESSGTPRIALFMAYDRTLPGMVGLAQLIPLGVGAWLSARSGRRLVWTALIALAAALVMWGVWPRALGADTLQPLVPFIGVGAAVGYLAFPRLRWLMGLAAIESFFIVSLTVLRGDADAWQHVLTTTTYAAALTVLVFWGFRIVQSDHRVGAGGESQRLEVWTRE